MLSSLARWIFRVDAVNFWHYSPNIYVQLADYLNPFPFRNLSLFLGSFSKYHCQMRLGWKTWVKYRHLFPHVPCLVSEDGSYPTSVDVFTKEPTYIEKCLFLYSCLSFVGNPYSQESLTLKRNYLLTKKKVRNYYKDKDFLEVTLTLLATFGASSSNE